MARIFLSYDREDAARARTIALALEKAGHQVWWDQIIKAGAQFGNEIEQALKDSDAVIVLWSERSVDSAWVRDEAAAGRDNGRLVPVLLDHSKPPMGFRQFQNIDLARWNGRAGSSQLEALLDAVADATTGQISASPDAIAAPTRKPNRWWLLVPAFAVVLLIAAFAFWRLSPGAPSVPLVAVTAADQSPGPKAWARDLLVKLASLQTADADALRLVDQGGEARPDLIFEVGGTMQPDNPEANLLLRSGKDRAVLWSKDFQQPGAKLGDLRQQVAYTAAQVLGCALDGLNVDGKPLDAQTLKLYLNGCSALAATDDSGPLRPLFLEITHRSPSFEGAWAKLLNIEAKLALVEEAAKREVVRRSLKQHILEARKVHPHMAAAYLAEASLLPGNAFFESMRLLDQAVEYNPDDSEALLQHMKLLLMVGRTSDALQDSRRAAQIDPLSPVIRDALISGLVYVGQTTAALQELAKAERLWPDSRTLADTRFWLSSIYGDPREAQRLLDANGVEIEPQWRRGNAARLEARIDPSRTNIQDALAEARAAAKRDRGSLGAYLVTLAKYGPEQELYRTLLQSRPEVARNITDMIFRPEFHEFWRDPRSMQVAAKLGLIEYWRRSGKWPDFCSDVPYDCKTEAAKLVRQR